MSKVERMTNCTTGGPVFVDVEDGKIVRLTPIDLDETDKGDWVIEARGRSFTPPRRTTLSPHAVAQKSMVYSPKRILTPLKRVDFDPKGNRNIQNRGVSGYEPISWDEALDIVADEVDARASAKWAPRPSSPPGSHHLWGNVGYRHSAYFRFMNLVGLRLRGAQPGQLGRLALGRHAHVGQHPPPGHPRAVRPPGRRPQAHRDGRLLVVGPGDHRRWHLLRLREHLPPLLDERARHQDGVHRPLLQPHRRSVRRQVVRPAPGHRRGLRPGHRLHLAHRGHLRQGVHLAAHRRLRRVEGLRARQDRRRAQDPGVGGGRERHPGAGDPGAGPGVGGQEDHAGRRRPRGLGRRLPLAPPATSGPAP